jgi:hypothetical protein
MISDQALRRWLPVRTVAVVGDLVRGVLWAGVIVVWAIYPQIYARMWNLTINKAGGSDFTIFYYTARLVADGLPMYGESPVRYGVPWASSHLGNLNPPHFQMLLQPLARLTYSEAYVAWALVNLAALGVALWLIVRGLGLRVTATGAAVVGALIMASTPFTSVAVTSEWSFVLLVPFTLAWLAMRQAQWGRAGAWMGACVALKLFFLLFIPWLLLKRQWRAVGLLGIVVLAWTALGIAVYGAGTYRLWIQSLTTVGWWWLPMNASWQGVVARVFHGGATVQAVLSAPGIVPALSVAGSVVIGAASVWWAYRSQPSAAGTDSAVLILLAGAILASPLGWIYYVPLVVGPLAGVLCTRGWQHMPGGWRVVAVVSALALYVPLEQAAAGQPSTAATLTFACSYFYGLAPSWMALMAGSSRSSA